MPRGAGHVHSALQSCRTSAQGTGHTDVRPLMSPGRWIPVTCFQDTFISGSGTLKSTGGIQAEGGMNTYLLVICQRDTIKSEPRLAVKMSYPWEGLMLQVSCTLPSDLVKL